MAALRGDISFRYLKQFFLVLLSFYKKNSRTMENALVRKYMDVNENERLFNITLRHKYK
jgi:hypothetical protein